MIDFINKKKWFFLFSGIVLLIGIISLLSVGLQQGIEFSGGTMMTLRFEREVSQDELRGEMANLGHSNAVIQKTESGDYLIRTSVLLDEEVNQIIAGLGQRFGEEPTVEEIYEVSGSIASEIVSDASIAVVIAAIGILVYVTWAFRKMRRSFRYGVCAIIALIHDVLVVLGVFSILGLALDLEIDAMFITGILTIIGYSVNDTIVVFDRIRENRLKNPGAAFPTIVNMSITETLGRSLNTAMTTLLVVLALLLLGGATLHNFVLVLLIGIITGTYSSICIASQLLVLWESGAFSRVFRRLFPRRMPAGG